MRRNVPNNIPIETMRSFVSILETGSFTKAAARLNLTQPAISAQIKRMQTIVGEELFQKDGVGIALTEKGEIICRYAQRILSMNDQILWSGRSEKRFRIGLPSVLAGQFIAKLRPALIAAGFKSVQYVCDRAPSLRKKLEAGHLDVALIFSGGGINDTTKIEWKEPLVWACHPQFVLSPGAPIPVISWPNSVPDQIATNACDQAELSYSVEFIGDQLTVLAEAVRLKLGYLCIAERAVPDGMKIAQDYFLPKLPAMHAGIYRNVDVIDDRFDALISCMGKALKIE